MTTKIRKIKKHQLKEVLIIFIFILIGFTGISNNTNKSAEAKRIESPPKIDGKLDEAIWKYSKTITKFIQYEPVYKAEPTQKTEVKILYDDEAIYIGAKMYDSAPDSILRQLGNRDDWDLNADKFCIKFDTYNNNLDAYVFQVSASGIQMDRRRCDYSFNAVWKSKVIINDEGWIAEIKIPYSAIRFPEKDIQDWGIQIVRNIRRNREIDLWALQVKGAPNDLVYWGKLKGINSIKTSLRLSLTPYISTAVSHYPFNIKNQSNYSYSFSSGMNLKLGINDSFTLDMTLLPDFSQVKSDNNVKNLSAFETVHSEQRPFFYEAVDLFHKGDLFYSRRIGGKPLNYYSVDDLKNSSEIITDNPDKAKLLNATKISGRNKNGLAIGFLNAITNNTYTEVKDTVTNEKRKILTDPLTNYNITVIDKALKNNSSIYLINTNVTRKNGYNNANVTGSGFSLYNKKNTYSLRMSGAVSQVFEKANAENNYEKNNKSGYKYNIFFGKVNGNLQFSISRNAISNTYDANDLGITQRNNEIINRYRLSYNIYEPFWILRNFRSFLQFYDKKNLTTKKNADRVYTFFYSGEFLNYLHFWNKFNLSTKDRYDYYDPRTEGRYIIRQGYYNTYLGISSDYRKKFALDASIYYKNDNLKNEVKTLSVGPRLRLNNKFSLVYEFKINDKKNDLGYVDTDTSSNIIYGKRALSTFENSLSGKFIFKNNLSINLWMRHYRYKGIYNSYYTLEDNGILSSNTSYNDNSDFNYNSFNIDFTFNWEFAPGSNFSLIWKNEIINEDDKIHDNYFDNFYNTLSTSQKNSVSLKILYYIDYQEIRKNLDKNNS